jgi:hypothetical protein
MPKVSSHVYLQANVTNISEFPLLAGDVNVFMDNNFVSRSSIKVKNKKIQNTKKNNKNKKYKILW